jgi:hypothetical protein
MNIIEDEGYNTLSNKVYIINSRLINIDLKFIRKKSKAEITSN